MKLPLRRFLHLATGAAALLALCVALRGVVVPNGRQVDAVLDACEGGRLGALDATADRQQAVRLVHAHG